MKNARPVLGMVGSFTLLASLTTYGVRAYTQPPASTPTTTRQAVSRQEEFDRIIIERERVIVSQLGLNPEQKRQYDALREQQKEKTHIFRTRRPHRPEEGMELNTWWNNNLREVFTSEQYNHYLRLWSTGPGSIASAVTDNESLAEKDRRILTNLNLTYNQRRQIRTHQLKMEQRRIGRQNLVQSGNREALMKYDAETVRINQGMKNILTPEQYRKYGEAWGVAPSSNSGNAFSPARAAL